jgi:excisionase family DNA binding protein
MLIDKKILTIPEVCEYTGYSKRYVYRLVKQGVLPASKPNGSRMFFSKEALENWMLGKSAKAVNTTS